MSRKVLLIKPHYNANENYIAPAVPLGLLSIATYLKKNGFSPIILDTTVSGDYLKEIESNIKDSFAVGISSMTAQVESAHRIAKFIKSRTPSLPIVWGGVHPTLFAEDTASSPFVDAVVRGEGEETVVELLNCLREGRDIKEVGGITYKSYGQVISTFDRSLIQKIETLNYDLIPGIEKYLWADLQPFIKRKVRCIDVHAGRGCSYRCTFCFENKTLSHRPKPAEELVSEITYLKNKYNIEVIGLQDSDFFANKERLSTFVDLMIKRGRGVKWFSNCRSNYFNQGYISEEFLKRMEASGCIKLGIGAESGSDIMLERIRKKSTVSQLINALNMLNKTNIWVSLSFIIGMPDETEADIKKTLKLISQITEDFRNLYIIGPAYYRPYPGSEMFERANELGFKAPGRLEKWGQAKNDRFGYLAVDNLVWLSEKNRRLACYVVNISDFRYFKNHKMFLFVYLFFKRIINFRINRNIWCCLWEDKLLELTRKIINFLRKNSIAVRV